MRILLSNDDGYLAPGLGCLAAAVGEFADITVVAPDRNRSGASNSLTLATPLRARRAANGFFFVDGTPTDCVILAIAALLTERPDICVSGVNHGPNMGEDVLYSGTVAAAMEATVIGIPAVAFSYVGRHPEELEGWESGLQAILEGLLKRDRFPEHTLFNVNLPAIAPGDVRGIKVTSLGRRRYADTITRADDPSGNEYFWIGGGAVTWKGPGDSDFQAIEDGYVSVTPLHLDLTNYKLLEEIRAWDLAL